MKLSDFEASRWKNLKVEMQQAHKNVERTL